MVLLIFKNKKNVIIVILINLWRKDERSYFNRWLESISTLAIGLRILKDFGAQLFNNFTSEEPEFTKIGQQILGSCENMIRDIEAKKFYFFLKIRYGNIC